MKYGFHANEENKSFGMDKQWKKDWIALRSTVSALRRLPLAMTFDFESDKMFVLHDPNIISKLKCKIEDRK